MNDRRLENILGRLLQTGVLLAATIVAAGAVGDLVRHPSSRVDYRVFTPGSADLRTLSGIARSAVHLHSEGLIQLGLLLLIATPVARVAMALVGFALERDRLYTMVSLIVLLILAFSLIHAA